MKQIISFLILFTLVLSCTSNTIYKEPDDLIQKDLMIELIGQMQIANAARSSKNIDKERSIEYMALVYRKYGIDSARFARSNFYYSTRIDEYKKLMQRVKLNINQLRDLQNTIVEELDSIEREENRAKFTNPKKPKQLKGFINAKGSVVK
jgi:hypothetical protein